MQACRLILHIFRVFAAVTVISQGNRKPLCGGSVHNLSRKLPSVRGPLPLVFVPEVPTITWLWLLAFLRQDLTVAQHDLAACVAPEVVEKTKGRVDKWVGFHPEHDCTGHLRLI